MHYHLPYYFQYFLSLSSSSNPSSGTWYKCNSSSVQTYWMKSHLYKTTDRTYIEPHIFSIGYKTVESSCLFQYIWTLWETIQVEKKNNLLSDRILEFAIRERKVHQNLFLDVFNKSSWIHRIQMWSMQYPLIILELLQVWTFRLKPCFHWAIRSSIWTFPL